MAASANTSPRYALACSCGKSLIVDAAQAGLRLACDCGRSVEVPTLRDLRRLPLVNPRVKPAPDGAWGVAEGMALFGGILTALAVCGAALLWAIEPGRPHPGDRYEEVLRNDVERRTLLQTFELWQILREGLDTSEPEELVVWRDQRRVRVLLTGVLGVVGTIGAGLAIQARGMRQRTTPARSSSNV